MVMKNRRILLLIFVSFLVMSFLSACGGTDPVELPKTSEAPHLAAPTDQTTEPSLTAVTTTEEFTESATEAVIQTTGTTVEPPLSPTEADIAAKLTEKYLNAVIDRVIWGTEIDLDIFAASDEYKEQLEQFTDSLVLQDIRAIHMFGGDVSELSIKTETGNFREENGVLVGNGSIYPKLTVNGEKFTFGQTIRLSFVFDGEECKISDATRVVRDLPTDIYLLEVQNRTTFSELNFVYENSSMSPEEELACNFVATRVENLVLGRKNDFSEIIGPETPDSENLAYAFWAIAGGYSGESFFGDPDVKIYAKTEANGPGYAQVGILVESGITIQNPGMMCSPTPADGFFRVTMEKDREGVWKMTDMTVVHGDYNIAIHAKIQKLYLDSLG